MEGSQKLHRLDSHFFCKTPMHSFGHCYYSTLTWLKRYGPRNVTDMENRTSGLTYNHHAVIASDGFSRSPSLPHDARQFRAWTGLLQGNPDPNPKAHVGRSSGIWHRIFKKGLPPTLHSPIILFRSPAIVLTVIR